MTRVWSGEQVLVVMYVVEAGEEVTNIIYNMDNICNIYIIYNIYAYLHISGLAIYAVDRAGGGELNLSPAEAACRQLAEGGGGEKPSRNNESFSRGL